MTDAPIPLESATLCAEDRDYPPLADVTAIAPAKTLVLGADGQLGRELRRHYAGAEHVEWAKRADIDLTSAGLSQVRHWSDYDTVINAAAFTAVDLAETPGGRATAWAVNVTGVGKLARIATDFGITLVHISSDYVFDGTKSRPYQEDDPVSPLGAYGQTKAAAELIVANVPRHYVIRTSWLLGDGPNFVRTMLLLASRNIDPSVVDDQEGRLTSTSDLVGAISHLLSTHAPYGTYNVTGTGRVTTWADIARKTFALAGYDPRRVRGVTTETYSAGARMPVAPRPRSSVLDLSKIEAAGYCPADVDQTLALYVRNHL